MTDHSDPTPESPDLDAPPPDHLLSSFRINMAQIPATKANLEHHRQVLGERIWQLSNKSRIGGAKSMPILTTLLDTAENPEELLVLGRATLAAAPMLGRLQEVQRRLVFLETLEHTPAWVAGQLGDFSELMEGLEDWDPGSEPIEGEDHPTP